MHWFLYQVKSVEKAVAVSSQYPAAYARAIKSKVAHFSISTSVVAVAYVYIFFHSIYPRAPNGAETLNKRIFLYIVLVSLIVDDFR